MEEFTIEVIKAFESRVIANQDISVKQFKSKGKLQNINKILYIWT
nr:MAG TPA: hypothetical protein [Caudoviricetes sp.]